MFRKMRKNHSTAMPAAIVLLDTETIEEECSYDPNRTLLKLFFGKARYIRLRKGNFGRRCEITFTNSVAFWSWLLPRLHPKTSTWLFAHNVAFDLTIVDFWQLLEAGILTFHKPDRKAVTDEFGTEPAKQESGLYVDNDPPTIIGTYTAAGGHLVCVDSLNYFPMALESLGSLLTVPKLARPSYAAPDVVWHRYCDQDLEILEKAITKLISWCRDNDYGKFRWTAAGIALAAYRHRLGNTTIDYDRPSDVMHLERNAYYGGRVEMIKTGHIDCEVFELDIASMYPSVMIDNWFPCKLDDTSETNPGGYADNVDPRLYTAAEVLIETEKDTYPVRCRDGTYYCTGRFYTTLCGPDLQHAFKRGHIRAVVRWARYRMQKLFTEYVTHFWEKRAEYARVGDSFHEHLCKSMLNSLYGKFGQQSPRWEDCECDLDPWPWGQQTVHVQGTGEWLIYRSIAGHVQQRVQPTEHKNSFAAISAWVTAYARQRIRQLVDIAGNRNVFYVVNDALYVNRSGLLNLQLAGEVQHNQLGKLRQKRYGKDAHFWAANNYRIGDERVISGVQKKAKQVAEMVYQEQVFQRLREITATRPASNVSIKLQYKVLLNKVKRAHVDPEGWTFPMSVQFDSELHLQAMRHKSRELSFDQMINLGTAKQALATHLRNTKVTYVADSK